VHDSIGSRNAERISKRETISKMERPRRGFESIRTDVRSNDTFCDVTGGSEVQLESRQI
jgi:hypothetical protein